MHSIIQKTMTPRKSSLNNLQMSQILVSRYIYFQTHVFPDISEYSRIKYKIKRATQYEKMKH